MHCNLIPSPGGDAEYRSRKSFSDREPCTIKKSKTGTELRITQILSLNNYPFENSSSFSLVLVYNPSLYRAEKFSRNTEQVRRGRVSLDHPRIVDVHNYRYAFSLTLIFHQEKQILLSRVQFFHECFSYFMNSVFVATWNVAGRSPPRNLSIDDWLHASPPADIYVLG